MRNVGGHMQGLCVGSILSPYGPVYCVKCQLNMIIAVLDVDLKSSFHVYANPGHMISLCWAIFDFCCACNLRRASGALDLFLTAGPAPKSLGGAFRPSAATSTPRPARMIAAELERHLSRNKREQSEWGQVCCCGMKIILQPIHDRH